MDNELELEIEIDRVWVSRFEQAVTEVRAYLAKRNVTVSRLKLRRAIVVYATKEKISPVRGAREVLDLLAKRVISPAELICPDYDLI